MAQHSGIYRGIILNSADPQAAGRVQVRVPNVFGAESAWAGVCMPFGASTGTRPQIGSQVWVMFEGGDPSRPVVLGAIPGG